MCSSLTLSSQILLSSPPAHSWSCLNFASPGSDQEWLTKASTVPSVALSVLACIAGSGVLFASSSRVSLKSGRDRKASAAFLRASAALLLPMSDAIDAAS